MKDFLQGKWLKHPLHPLLVHVPSALWPAALFFDVLANVGFGGNAVVQTAFCCMLFGWLVALLAIPAGLADWSDIKRDKPAWKIGVYHMGLNIAATLVWGVNLLVRAGSLQHDTTVPFWPFLLSFVGTGLVVVSGYLGGKMVYDYGVGIARMSRGRWRRIAKAGGARLPSEAKSGGGGEASAGEAAP